jgi:hypothetical protein
MRPYSDNIVGQQILYLVYMSTKNIITTHMVAHLKT